LNLADCKPACSRQVLITQEAGIKITPYSRDRWFPATCANFSSLKEHPAGQGLSAPILVLLITYPGGQDKLKIPN